jgi:hypothetical protein
MRAAFAAWLPPFAEPEPICIATTPPNGPAGFAHLTKQAFDTAPSVAEHLVPAGIATTRGYILFCQKGFKVRESDPAYKILVR